MVCLMYQQWEDFFLTEIAFHLMKQNQVTHNRGTHPLPPSSLQLSINLAYPTNLTGQTNQRGKSKEKPCQNPGLYCLLFYF